MEEVSAGAANGWGSPFCPAFFLSEAEDAGGVVVHFCGEFEDGLEA